jgi:enoyl-CoA hydratase/carnithine racemase
MSDFETLTIERRGHVLLVGLNRPEKRNAADLQLLHELSLAYAELENDPDLRVGFVFAHGDHFTGGLDLADVAGKFGDFDEVVPEGGLDPWRNDGTRWTTPVIVAAQGMNYTAGIELMLAADIRLCADDS